MFVPSNARPEGCDPTVTVFSAAPDTGSSSTTFPSADSVTHTPDPSNAAPFGAAPADRERRGAGRRSGTGAGSRPGAGFFPPVVTPVAEATLDIRPGNEHDERAQHCTRRRLEPTCALGASPAGLPHQCRFVTRHSFARLIAAQANEFFRPLADHGR